MKNNSKIINVTKPTLPELKDYLFYLEEIWKSRCLSNRGPFAIMLEEELKSFLKVKYIGLVASKYIGIE